MADVNDFLIRAGDLRNGTSADLLGDLVERLNLSLSLDLVEGVAVGGVTNTKTINGKSAVASSGGCVHVRVVVVVVRQVPVTEKN